MNAIFLDTWAFQALADRHHRANRTARDRLRQAARLQLKPMTSSYVMAETLTLLRAQAGYGVALEFGKGMLRADAEGIIEIVSIDTDEHRLLETAWRYFKRYGQLEGLSFIDCTSWAVMKRYGITYALAEDENFERVNLGFRIFRG
jgi:predicted nucleic acid-binding protein